MSAKEQLTIALGLLAPTDRIGKRSLFGKLGFSYHNQAPVQYTVVSRRATICEPVNTLDPSSRQWSDIRIYEGL